VKCDGHELVNFTGVTRKFYNHEILRPVFFSLTANRGLAILGPNGAGKTTMIRILLGVIPPSTGTVRVFGQPIGTTSFGAKKRIGVVIEEQTFFLDKSAWEYLCFFGELYEVKDMRERASALLRYMGLYENRFKKIKAYSTGMKKKLNIIQAVLHQPEILVLDEPFSGLDPLGISLTTELLGKMKNAGSTLILSSHILSEIDDLVEDMLIINAGTVKAYGSKQALWEQFDGAYGMRLTLLEENEPGISHIRRLPGVVSAEKTGELQYVFSIAGNKIDKKALSGAIPAFNMLVSHVSYTTPSVKMIYDKIMNGGGPTP
jgi:ABC-2 type transport system ATP-binding protein